METRFSPEKASEVNGYQAVEMKPEDYAREVARVSSEVRAFWRSIQNKDVYTDPKTNNGSFRVGR